MKITIYELLGMIKDGKAPKKIKYQNYIYEYQHRRDTKNSFNYICNENGEYLSRRYFIDNILNDKVEILKEEKKIPEKINEENSIWEEQARDIDYYFKNTINDIVDYLKSKGE